MRRIDRLGLVVFLAVCWPALAQAVPPLVNNQGVIRTEAGTPVPDGKYSLTFSLYDADDAVKALWTETVNDVNVQGGFYSSVLGGGVAFPPDLFRKNASLWLGIKVDNNAELPRRRLLTVAYAFEADHALVATTSEAVACNGCIQKDALGFDVCKTSGDCLTTFDDLKCNATQIPRFNGTSWFCDKEVGQEYKAGAAMILDANVFSVDQQAVQNWAKLVCYDSPSELMGALNNVYAPIKHTHEGADIKSPVNQALEAGNALALEGKDFAAVQSAILAEVAKAGYLNKNDKLTESQMPANGLNEVSNNLITNQFTDSTASPNMPKPIPDQNPIGVADEFTFPDIGIAEKLTVSVDISSSNINQIRVFLYDPDNVEYLLYDKGSSGPKLATSYPDPTPAVAGNLSNWVGKNPKGTWRLKVIDTAWLNNQTDGQINSWSINIQTLSTKKLKVAGNLEVTGYGSIAGDLTVGGKVTVIGRPVASIWTAENDSLADGGNLDVNTGIASPLLVAQAWFQQDDGSWLQASTAADVQTIGGCTECGDGSNGNYLANSNTTLAGGTYNYKSFTINQGVTVTVTGSNPLIIKVQGDVAIDGVLDLRGKAGEDVTSQGTSSGGAGGGGGGGTGGSGVYGSAGGSGSGTGPGGGGCNSSTGSGGGGAGHAGNGTVGGTTNYSCSTGGSAGSGYNDSLLGQGPKGGSGGGAGGYGSGANSQGAGGGGGGGAVKITAMKVTIGSQGAIYADGGAGGNVTGDWDGGAGGGGSGGTVWLRGSQVNVLGVVTAKAGAGGAVSQQGSYWGGVGGAGAPGRIRVDGQVVGTTNPQYVPGDTLGLAPLVVNKFLISQPSPGVARLTNKSGKVQKVKLIIMR